MVSIEHRLEALENRLRAVEDQMEIYQLIAAYGPAVDSLSGAAAAALWQPEGSYQAGEFAFSGKAAIEALVDMEPHRSYVADGCAHVLSLPHLTITGDTAVARNYSRIYRHDGTYWRIERASANRWELARGPDGWQVVRRTNRLLNGEEAARDLLKP